jgi:hypothetical protein
LPDRVRAPQVTFLASELVQAAQRFLIVVGFLGATFALTNSWAGSEKLKVFSFQILSKDGAYILSNLRFFCSINLQI